MNMKYRILEQHIDTQCSTDGDDEASIHTCYKGAQLNRLSILRIQNEECVDNFMPKISLIRTKLPLTQPSAIICRPPTKENATKLKLNPNLN